MIAVFASGCSGGNTAIIKTYSVVYEPVRENNVKSYYVGGLPMGSFTDEKYSILFALQSAEVADRTYLRLWVLYENNTDEEFLFDPVNSFKLSIWEKDVKRYELNPDSPLQILKDIEESKQKDIVNRVIGGALRTLTASTDSQVLKEIDRTENKASEISGWYARYSNSINSGILRRNTLFAKKSVNGYLYFNIPFLLGNRGSEIDYFMLKYNIKVMFDSGNGMKEIKFKTVAGE